MDWEAIGAGGWPDNTAFAALPADRRAEVVESALDWASLRVESAPAAARRVAETALHLLDSHGLDEPLLRARSGLLVGVAATRTGDSDEAVLHYEEILNAPPAPGTEWVRLAALINCGAQLSDSDPQRAFALLDEAFGEALSSGALLDAANVAVTLGSLHRREGRFEEARQVYETGLCGLAGKAGVVPEPGTPDGMSVLACLHGNLGNLLTDDLERHREAARHFTRAVACFQAAGDTEKADQRYFHLVCAHLAAGDFDQALTLFVQGRGRSGGDAFRQVLSEGRWTQAPAGQLPSWEAAFTATLEKRDTAVTAEGRALLLAARVHIRARLDDPVAALALLRDGDFTALPDGVLRRFFQDTVIELAQSSGCRGAQWALSWLHDTTDLVDWVGVKAAFLAERATAVLLERARTPGAPELPVPPGVGAAPEDVPAWLGPVEPGVRAHYRRLRRRHPSREELEKEIHASFGLGRTATESEARSSQVRLRTALRAADLLGHPWWTVRCRTNLAIVASVQGGNTPEARLREARILLDQARELADGLPRERQRVSLTLATVLKENSAWNESALIEEAITVGREAMDLAERHGFRDTLPDAALTLGNALSEYTEAGVGQLHEARRVLERGLEVMAEAPDRDAEEKKAREASLLNSLGKALVTLARRERRPERATEAAGCFRRALTIRERLDDRRRELLTATNLLGTVVGFAERPLGEAPAAEVRALVDRVRLLAPQVDGPALVGGALTNAASALDVLGLGEQALRTALEAVDILRGAGQPRWLTDSLFNAAGRYVGREDLAAALELLDEALDEVEALRVGQAPARYKAEVTRGSLGIRRLHATVLRRLGRSPEERWWASDRHTGRALTAARTTAPPPRADLVRALGARLPHDVLLLHIHIDETLHLACFVLRNGPDGVRVEDGARRIPLAEVARATGGSESATEIRLHRLTPDTPDTFRALLTWLGARFLGPVLDATDSRGLTRIAVTAADLNWVPWHAVPLPDTGIPLGRTWEVLQIPNAEFLARALRSADPPLRKAAFVACDPSRTLRRHIDECRRGFAALSGPERLVLTDSSRPVTRDAVTRLLAEADLFHFAGHSVLDADRPDRSGLMLSDGLFTLSDLERACAGGRAPSVVFLSSCESAAADPRLADAPTLATAFLGAGGRVAIGALWEVPDGVAARMARSFYENLPGHTPVEALSAARSRLPENHWPAFTLHGWSTGRPPPA
ncbi:CHAT domain-containing protein [Streptomyces antibioticus]|uniref:CHAT domain-containing protein n=1 Tax=Streptomyces antibioticus TaxID=1890 RepID=UPI0036D0942D